MNQKNKTLISSGILLGLLISLDQWTKRLAIARLMGKPSFVIIKNVFEFQYLENRGAAFGLFQNKQIFFFIITAGVLVFAIYYFMKMPFTKKYDPLRLCIVGLGAGAIGNLIDRVSQGYVVDFMYFKLINFPIFNVADCYVTMFTIVLALLILFVYNDEDLKFLSGKEKEVI